MKEIVILATSVGSLNVSDEIVKSFIRLHWVELYEQNSNYNYKLF